MHGWQGLEGRARGGGNMWRVSGSSYQPRLMEVGGAIGAGCSEEASGIRAKRKPGLVESDRVAAGGRRSLCHRRRRWAGGGTGDGGESD
jgi:hypothetical protein